MNGGKVILMVVISEQFVSKKSLDLLWQMIVSRMLIIVYFKALLRKRLCYDTYDNLNN